MEIETGNRLIAEFMGYSFLERKKYPEDILRMVYLPTDNTQDQHGWSWASWRDNFSVYIKKNLNYHSSLDSLMPVIEKIETLGYNVVLASYQAQVYDNNNKKMIIDADFSSKFLENAYGAVVCFIKYYQPINP